MNPLLRAAIGGLIGGLIGTAVWAGIGYASHRELGLLAWAVGGVTGIGVRYFAREHDGASYGFLAVTIALLSIVLGKYMVVSLIANDLEKQLDGIMITVGEDDMIAEKADEVAAEWKAKGKAVSAGKDVAGLPTKNYLPAVTAEAQKRWKALPLEERTRLMAEEKAKIDTFKKTIGSSVRRHGFAESFTPFDILWFLLAAVTAFKIGSGMAAAD